ncbi:MAG: Trk system potassium transporter TrkA [Rhodocyclales bacterium]|nr:Trk system potassium transporter TrkA [Rhodocyclales bacterium]
MSPLIRSVGARGIRRVMRELRRMLKPVRQVMIAGAGNIGARVAARLERDYDVKLVEHDRARAETVATRLPRTLVLCGDATDEKLLTQENIDEMDMFLALTNDDEDNIMASSLAKRLGCKRVLALINRRAYADMVQGGPIDIGISPAQISIGSLLAHVRRADVVKVHSLRRGAAEALEMVAHGDRHTSKVVGRRIGELPDIKGARIAALVRRSDDTELAVHDNVPVDVRGFTVIIPHHDTVVAAEDHVIVLCTRKQQVPQVEKLFQVSAGFL